MTDKKYNVLFLCTGNSARSIMAESILRKDGDDRFIALSAGSHPKGSVNPLATKILQSHGYPTIGARSKPWDEFTGEGAPELDFVFTVCDNAAGEVCPVWPGQPMTAHWGIEDPAAVEGTDMEKERAFVAGVPPFARPYFPIHGAAAREPRQDVADQSPARNRRARRRRASPAKGELIMSEATTTAGASGGGSVRDEFIRTLSHAVGRALHRRRNRARASSPRRVPRDWRGDRGASQFAGRRAGLADDHSDAAQDRPRGAKGSDQALARRRRDGRRQLAGEAVLDGAAGLAVRRASVPAVPARRSTRRLYRRSDPAGGGALHGDGVRLVEPRRGRAAFHAVASRAERLHHDRGLRADRRAVARPLVHRRAVEHAAAVGRALHRRCQ